MRGQTGVSKGWEMGMGLAEQWCGSPRVVPENERMGILPKYVGGGQWLMLLEATIFAQLGSMCESYKGGYWEMVETGNGSFFMWPRIEVAGRGGMLDLSSDSGSSRLVSGEAAGIVATLYGLNKMCWSTRKERHDSLFRCLMDFARTHAEWPAIQALID